MKDKKHLPLFGVGPIYVVSIMLITALAAVASSKGLRPKIEFFKPLMLTLGVVLILSGIGLWCAAVFGSRMDKNIVENKLVTTGVYAYVRNPMYSGVMMTCTGVILCCNNIVLLVLPFVYWAYMTILMKNTEEKWLLALYGKDYEEYNGAINRSYVAIGALFFLNSLLDILFVKTLGLFGVGLASTISCFVLLLIMLPAYFGRSKTIYF